MVEFGEQLRRAREAKGMTQQSLAEQLFVTRQAVSRWECGDRFPDLLTTKKISQILEVSLDDLLSGKDMEKVVERNPVIENKAVNNIMIVLYAFIVFSFMVRVLDVVYRLPMASNDVELGAIEVIAFSLVGAVLQIVVFIFGLVNSIKGTLSPKRMGVVNVVFFGAMCLSENNYLFHVETWKMVGVLVLLTIPSLAGAVASFMYYINNKNHSILIAMIILPAVWGIIRNTASSIIMIRSSIDGISLYASINTLLTISIYVLIIYQTMILLKKRMASTDIRQNS